MNSEATDISIGPLNGTLSGWAEAPSSGDGSAFLSTLPFAVSGSASSITNAAGSMDSGSLRASPSRRSAGEVDSPAAGTHVRREAKGLPRRRFPGGLGGSRAPPTMTRRHHGHGPLRDARLRPQGRLDLAELDADAADLDLIVGAAEEL